MATQLSVAVRNARLNAIATTVGAAALLELYSGSMPANAATAASGTLLCTMTLPSTYMAAASGGVAAKTGTWTGVGASGAGSGITAGYFRLMDPTNTTCHAQGVVTIAGGGGDMTLDNPNIAVNQVVTVNTFSLTDGNA